MLVTIVTFDTAFKTCVEIQGKKQALHLAYLPNGTYICPTPSFEHPFPSSELPLTFKTDFMNLFRNVSERTGAFIFFGCLIALLITLYKLTN